MAPAGRQCRAAQIARDALLDLRHPPLHLGAREVLVAVVDCLELAAINRDAGLRQQAHRAAQCNKLSTNFADGSAIVLAEVGNRLVIGYKPTQQLHHLNVAPSLVLKPPTRLNSIEIAVDVKLHKPAGRLRHFEQGSPVSHTRANSYAHPNNPTQCSILHLEEDMKQSLSKRSLSLMVAAVGVLVSQSAWAQISDGVVKLGVLNDMSSLYADVSGRGGVLAAQMAVEDFGGKVLGAPIEVISGDHQNKPDVGAGIARQWIDADHVDAIVDVPTSSVALAVQDVTREKKRIFLMSGPASSDLTGKACSPYGIQWTYDTYALAHGTGGAIVKQGGTSWFFITADYAFGHALERDTAEAVKAAGGTVFGAVRAPLNTQDFSSYLLQAQASKAKVIGLANAGGDTINSIKQAGEFGIVAGGQKLAGLLVFLSDIHSLGLKVAQGLTITSAWYWDKDDPSARSPSDLWHGIPTACRPPTFKLGYTPRSRST